MRSTCLGVLGALLSPALAVSQEPAAPAAEPAPDAGAPEAPSIQSRISGVTLYSDQALVVRSGAIDLPAGRSRWEVSGLPAAIRDEAVRARIVAGAGARLANLE